MPPYVPLEQRQRIVELSLQGWSQRAICRLMNRSRAAVSRIIRTYRDHGGSLADRERSGRPRATDTQTNSLIVACVVVDPFIDAKEIRRELQLDPRSRMGSLSFPVRGRTGHAAVPPPHEPPPEVHLSLQGASKRRTSSAALQQAAAGKLDDELLIFTDGSVLQNGSAAAACLVPETGHRRLCRLPLKKAMDAVHEPEKRPWIGEAMSPVEFRREWTHALKGEPQSDGQNVREAIKQVMNIPESVLKTLEADCSPSTLCCGEESMDIGEVPEHSDLVTLRLQREELKKREADEAYRIKTHQHFRKLCLLSKVASTREAELQEEECMPSNEVLLVVQVFKPIKMPEGMKKVRLGSQTFFFKANSS
ncbi:hypothetical protein HPB50_007333 [Hyalomma asiaticum]|uniref:Uncharacterized protein n=1 Tax=Hyalomma asiaticum TaxID=266040 RepID=A0ACB7ST68_HYAAI|nr:hypothetical protein HPB50_007333 [Hyalomma asiaticum]